MKSPITVFTITTLLLITGCAVNKNKINPNDNTPPTATIKVQMSDGQYVAVPNASLNIDSTNQLKLMCIADDPDGVQSVTLEYLGKANTCTVPDTGEQSSGSFTIIGLPAPQMQTLQGDPSGQVLTTLPLLATINAPLSCHVAGKTGFPFGSTVTVRCTATNWSSQKQSAVQDLPVALQ